MTAADARPVVRPRTTGQAIRSLAPGDMTPAGDPVIDA